MRWDSITQQALYSCPICQDEGWESRTYEQDRGRYMDSELSAEKASGYRRARPCECERGVAIAAAGWREKLKSQSGGAALERLRYERPAFAMKVLAYLGEHPDTPAARTSE
jgi:hypothetical protein